MGGADAVGLAVKVARGLAMIEEPEVVRFSLGPAFQQLEDLKRVVEGASWRSEMLVSVPSLLPVFLDSEIAIVAGGITMHEVACCGVPSVAACQPIDHQLLVAGWLEKAGAMLNLGYGTDIEPEEIASADSRLIGDQPRRQRMADAGPRTVDGLGTRRVAEEIASLVNV
jgi:spore coat polysaccharide biosynthesis predicted glycosyltransferase SpsG